MPLLHKHCYLNVPVLLKWSQRKILLVCQPVVCVSSVSAELPVLSLSGCSRGDGVVVGLGSGPEPPVKVLLEQLAELWERDCCTSTPLHLLFSPLTVTAVLKASDTEVR